MSKELTVKTMKIRSFLLFFVILSTWANAQEDSCVSNVTLGLSFPPITDATQMDFTLEHMDSLNVSMIRAAENWSFREPSQGIFNWGPLDSRMTWVANNNISLLLTIQSNGPTWACDPTQTNANSCVFVNPNEFQTYIDTLLKRYPNQIDKIQFGNEWHSDFWWIGNAQEFITAHNMLYNSVQQYSPQTQVVLGGFASTTMTTLAACYGYIDSAYDDSGNFLDTTYYNTYCNLPEIIAIMARQDSILAQCNYDIVDMHLYDDVERWPLYHHIMDSITNGAYPIIVTEMGGPHLVNEQPYSDAYQADKLYEYIKTVDSLNISEAYFFKLVDGGTAAPWHQESGLIDNATLLEKESYWMFKTMNRSCAPNSIQDDEDLEQGAIYPNPTTGELAIRNLSVKQVEVLDLGGKSLYRHSDQSGIRNINVSEYPSGMYLLRLLTTDDETIVHRIVVE